MTSIPLDYEQPEVIRAIVPIRQNTRPGTFRNTTFAIVNHNTGDDDVPAWNYWKALQNEDYKVYGSYHILLDLNADVWVVIPVNEIAFGSGSTDYTDLGATKFRSQAWKYTVDIEVCTHSPRYKMTTRQCEVLAEINADLMIEFNLQDFDKNIYRHYDIAKDRPECPWFMIEHPSNWTRHLAMTKKFYELKKAGEFPRLEQLYKA